MYVLYIPSFQRGDNKKIAKSMFLVGLGVGATIAYQKYSEPAMKKLEKFVDKTVRKVDQEINEMM